MKKKVFVFSLIAFVILGLLGCNNSNTASTSGSGNSGKADDKQEVLKIGVIGPLSGAGAGWGLPLQYGVEMAVKELNDNGGLTVGGKKYKVQTIAYDDQYNGDETVKAANRLIFEDKVKYIIGTIGSAGVLGMQTITEKNKVLILTNSYSSKALSPDKPFTFRALPTNLEWGKGLINWMKDKYPDKTKVAFLSPNDESGWQVQKNAEKDFVSLGYKIVANEFPERNTQDYNPVLTKILNKNPEVIAFGGTSPGEMGVAMNQARALGFKGIFTSFGGPAIQEVLKVAGKNAENFVYYAQTDFNNKNVQNLVNKYGKDYKKEYLEVAPDWYDAAVTLFNAIKSADSLDTTKVAEQLRNTKTFPGLSGEMKWTGMDNYGINQQITKPIVIGQVQNGKPVIVDTVPAE